MNAQLLIRRGRVLHLLLEGQHDSEIAASLGVSPETVKRDIRKLLADLLADENKRRGGNS